LAIPSHPSVIVGLGRPDDAGVYQLTEELALVQTVDFFTPIVDDPYLFGQVAVANALSDVYAMGGTPLCAMNIVCFPARTMDIAVLHEVLRGGLEKLREADVTLVGGHSVDDAEIKYGLSVTGTIHPRRVLTKGGGRPGDRLLLTKPLGTGIINTALKRGQASAEAVQRVTASMIALNRVAAELIRGTDVHACTDVTGFGLLGHAAEMIDGGEVGLACDAAAVPLFPEALPYAEAGLKPGGLQRNRDYRASMIDVAPSVPGPLLDVLYDPQTSGGLLAAVPAEQADDLLRRLRAAGATAAIVGEVVAAPAGRIAVR
jgi:selenide, water dikinase